MADIEDGQKNKSHRTAHSGRKAQKKKGRSLHFPNVAKQQRNPKAYAIQSATKAERQFRRTMDIKSKGYHVPAVDRTPVKPPPAIVAIVGPPKVGKSTLLHCLVKNFTRNNMSTAKGPITVVSGKKKRITFIESNNDINQMIDIAKIADMVLLLIDAKSGFEMETFEFLNICQVHGMPRIMGVLTHLDMFKNKKALQKTKVSLKKRYNTEFPYGEKMFYLSGILHGEYLKNEVHNLARFLSVMKYQLSSWKKLHPYVLADRMEDITDPELIKRNPSCDRTVCLYGYARGAALKNNSYYHIPGCGDHFIRNLNFLPDPCPLPEKNKKRSLNEKERLIYAPMSGVGGVVYDKDAVYIELKGSHSHSRKPEEIKAPSDSLVDSLMTAQEPIDEMMNTVHLSLFSGAEPLTENSLIGMDRNESTNEDEHIENECDARNNSDSSEEKNKLQENEMGTGFDNFPKNCHFMKKRKRVYENTFEADESSDSCCSADEKLNQEGIDLEFQKKHKKHCYAIAVNLGEQGHAKWKDKLLQKAANSFYRRQQECVNLHKSVYGASKLAGNEEEKSVSDEEVFGDMFHISRKRQTKTKANINELECSKFVTDTDRNWTREKEMDSIKDCFVTGKWAKDEDAGNLLQNDEELFDFEDVEGITCCNDVSEQRISDMHSRENEEKSETKPADEKQLQEQRLEKKKNLKEIFNAHFDEQEAKSYHDDLKMEADKQGELNRKEFESIDDELRVHFEGYRPGLYLRIEVENVPCEFINNFDPSYPIIVGGLLNGENKMGYVQVRMKKHRWYPKILKTRDPLILSLGWRRFQTIPLYYISDHNGRNRLLKYTPKHLHCMASFWGPLTPQKSGFCAVQTMSETMSSFRIAAVGAVVEVDQTTEIVKKLKLLGTPFEIFRKTAFIEGMFHSPLEVVKYEGAVIRTVSGIRGQIKKALRKPPGIFRATFEDKILMSDTVFLRTWVKVEVPQFCVSLYTLLLPERERMKWQGMRTLGHLRFDKSLHTFISADSQYTPVERKPRYFAPLVVPKKIQKELPFQDKVLHLPKESNDSANCRIAVVREPQEREVAKAIQMLKTVHKMKTIREKQAMRVRVKTHRKEMHKENKMKHWRLQKKKKRIMQYKKTEKESS